MVNKYYRYIRGHKITEKHLGTAAWAQVGGLLERGDIWGNEMCWPPTDKGILYSVFARGMILSKIVQVEKWTIYTLIMCYLSYPS